MKKTITHIILATLMALAPFEAFSQSAKVKVSGTVIDGESGEPLIGVTVLAENMNGVTTYIDGSYSIDVEAGTSLTYSYMGYKDEVWSVPTDVAEAIHNVQMHSDSEVLEDVVVIAYGVRKKGTVAGSVSTVKSEKIENTPTAAFDQALQGQVAGLSVMSNTGEPSASAVMTIRGTNSINSGTAPLYILDGVPISASDFNTINPADIESLSVLKDASSTSSEAALPTVHASTTACSSVSRKPMAASGT